MLERVVALAPAVDGADAVEVALAPSELASAQVALGQAEAAEALYRRSADALAGRSVRAHTQVLHNLGHLLLAQGRLDEAQQAFEDALRMREEHVGREHADVAQSLMNLGALQQARGQRAEAGRLLHEALQIRRRVLPEGHPDTGLNEWTLGELLVQDPAVRAQAANHLAAAEACLARHFAPEHAQLRRVRAVLVQARAEPGKA